MHKKIILVVISFLSCVPFLHAQKLGLSVQASINYPYIPSLTTPKEYPVHYPVGTGYVEITNGGNSYGQSQELYDCYTGEEIGINAEYTIKGNLFLKTGVDLSLVRFKRTIIVIPLEGNKFKNNSDYYPNVGKTSIMYVDIPLGVGYRFFRKKLSIGLGCNVSFIAYSEQHVRKLYTGYYVGYGPEEKDKSSDGLNNTTFSPYAEASWLFFKKFSVFGRYSHQLNPIFDKDNQYAGKARLQLFEMGLGYQFL